MVLPARRAAAFDTVEMGKSRDVIASWITLANLDKTRAGGPI